MEHVSSSEGEVFGGHMRRNRSGTIRSPVYQKLNIARADHGQSD